MNSPKPKKHKELKPQDLRWKCDPDIFKFSSTSDFAPKTDDNLFLALFKLKMNLVSTK